MKVAILSTVVQRGDVAHGVRPSNWHDPTFAAAVARAAEAGVEFRALKAHVSVDGTELTHELPVDVEGNRTVVSCVQVLLRVTHLNVCMPEADDQMMHVSVATLIVRASRSPHRAYHIVRGWLVCGEQGELLGHIHIWDAPRSKSEMHPDPSLRCTQIQV